MKIKIPYKIFPQVEFELFKIVFNKPLSLIIYFFDSNEIYHYETIPWGNDYILVTV